MPDLGWGMFQAAYLWTYLGSGQESKIYILVFLGFGQVFGQSWAQQRAQRPRLEKGYMYHRTLTREIDSNAPRN